LKSSYVICLLWFLLGCGNEEIMSTPKETATKPDRIDLVFNPLQLDELQRISVLTTDWELVNSIPFGQIEGKEIELDVYKVKPEDEYLGTQLNGILKIQEARYQIIDLSSSLIEIERVECPQVCLFQRLFSNQEQFELLGSIELSSNGPGLKLYVINDLINKNLNSFTSWGEPSFIDLDDDGNDEFIIEFQGQHLSWPDISLIRANNGLMEESASVLSSFSKNQGDFAKLTMGNKPPLISISNVDSENEPVYHYLYNGGVLEKVETE